MLFAALQVNTACVLEPTVCWSRPFCETCMPNCPCLLARALTCHCFSAVSSTGCDPAGLTNALLPGTVMQTEYAEHWVVPVRFTVCLGHKLLKHLETAVECLGNAEYGS